MVAVSARRSTRSTSSAARQAIESRRCREASANWSATATTAALNATAARCTAQSGADLAPPILHPPIWRPLTLRARPFGRLWETRPGPILIGRCRDRPRPQGALAVDPRVLTRESRGRQPLTQGVIAGAARTPVGAFNRSEEHTSELQSLMRTSDAV